MNKVQLAISRLGGPPGVGAYHSSVLVNGEEFSFSNGGITAAQGPASHSSTGPPRVLEMGSSPKSARELVAAVGPHFEPGSYDLLRKNCNSFSDAALFFLLQRRLDAEYRALERLGARQPALLQLVSGGQYTANPKAANFDLERLIADLDPQKAWRTPGHTTGGEAASSSDAMRCARLARFNATPGAPEDGLASRPARLGASVEEEEEEPGPPSPPLPAPPTETGSSEQSVGEDERLARRLAEEEDERFARQLLAQEQRQARGFDFGPGTHGAQLPEQLGASLQLLGGAVQGMVRDVSNLFTPMPHARPPPSRDGGRGASGAMSLDESLRRLGLVGERGRRGP